MQKRFYDYFPPFAHDSVDFLLKSTDFWAINDARDKVSSAYFEFLDKFPESVTESDAKRWEAVYNDYRKTVLENLREEYKQDFLDGKIV